MFPRGALSPEGRFPCPWMIKLVEKRSSVKPRAERPAPVAAPVDEAPVAEEAAPAVAAEEAPAADAE